MSSKTNLKEDLRQINTSKARQDMHVGSAGKRQIRGTFKTAATRFPPKNSTRPIKGLPDREEVTRFAQDLVSSGFWQSCSLEASHGPAEWKCLHCGDYMCSSCTNLHKRGKKNRQHCILHISRQLDEDSIRKDLFCSKHGGREKEMYCKTDREKICEKCETESHSHHNVVSLSYMAGEARSHVGECLDQVDKSIPKYTKIFERLDNYIAETENQAVENCRIIDKAVEEIISMVKSRGMQLKNEENTRLSLELRGNLVKKRYDLELDMQRMKKTLFESRKFLETSNDIELINGASNYIEQLSSLTQPDYEKMDKELSPVTRITVQHVRAQLEGLEIKEVKHEGSRLSAAAASKLRDKNPGITDLSDPNRPLKLSEKISELYDNEWTNAMEHLEDADVKETEGIEILLNIITILFDHLSVLGDKQLENLSKMIVMPDFDPQMNEENILKKIPELPIEILKPLKDFRKKHADLAIQRLQKKLTKDVLEDKLEKSYLESCSEYIASCIELVWLMRVQDPPVCIEWNIKTDDDFDTNTMRSYTKSGKYVDFVVWPILYLHKGGPLLCKGVVQGKKMRNVGEEEQLHVQDKENKDKPSEFENFNGEKQFDEGNTQDDSGIQVQRDDTNSNHDLCIPPDINNDSHGDDTVKIQNDEVNVELSPSQEGIMSDPSMSTLGDDSTVIPLASMAAATCEETCVEGRDRSRSSGQSSQGSDSKETYQDAREDSGSESEQNEADESFSDCKTGDVHDNEGKMDEELE